LITTEGENVMSLSDKDKKITIQTGGGHQIEMDDNVRRSYLQMVRVKTR
jgi:hypothetical protein